MSSLKVCSWLIDFGPSSSPISVSNQPPASRPRDLPASASPHLPKRCFEKLLVEPRQVADLANAERVQVLLRHFADARHFAHIERREERGLLPGDDPQHAVRLGLVGADLGDQPRARNADRAVETASRPSCARAAGARRAAAGRRGARCRSYRGRPRRSTPSRPAGEKRGARRRPSASTRDSAPGGRRRRSPAGRACTRCAAASRSGRRICAPRRMRR